MTLEDVKIYFDLWRTKKNHIGEAIPDYLWKKVHAITSKYKPSKIYKTLGINSTQFTSHMKRISPSKFIEIPLESLNNNDSQLCQIKITHGNKVLSFELSVNYMDKVIPSLEKLMQ